MSEIFMLVLLLRGLFRFSASATECIKPSITTVSGTHAPRAAICPGDLIFEDNFNEFDLSVWSHELSLGGGGNWEFQWYTNNRSNSYSEEGVLHIKPTLVADEFGRKYLYTGSLDLNGNFPVDSCTDPRWFGCARVGNRVNILNPIKSAKIRTVNSFSFRYGKVEIRAKLPRGDWLWPAIWLMPRYNQYSSWPSSGEIDLMESRGNLNLISKEGRSIGPKQVSSTLHWGPNSLNYNLTSFQTNDLVGFDDDFHNYQLEWDLDQINLLIDDVQIGNISPPDGGFWEFGKFNNTTLDNPWKGRSKMAPFDQEFYIIINLACGGISFFPDDATNRGGKPWLNNSTRAATDFWAGLNQWLPTWKYGENIFKIDYVKVWAL